MAAGDKIYIADKETLDNVKETIDLMKPEIDKIDGVKTSIGNTNDSDGTAETGSSMAKLNKLITDLTSALEKINSIDGKISGNIKSIQRGVKRVRLDVSNGIDIRISTINPQKSFVLLNSNLAETKVKSSSAYSGELVYLKELSSNSLKLETSQNDYFANYAYCNISYQIIEFY